MNALIRYFNAKQSLGIVSAFVFCDFRFLALLFVQSAVHAQLLSILDRLTSLDERFNAFDGRITALDQRVTALDQRMERRVGDVSNKVEELLRQSNSVSSKVICWCSM